MASWLVLTLALQAPPQGPAAYWPLDEAATPSRNVVGDFSHGAWNGCVVSTDIPAANTFTNLRSLSFDGVDDYVEFANSAQMENVQESDYTLSAWFNPADVPVAGTNEGRYAILYKAGYHLGIAYNRSGTGNGQFVFEHWLTGNVWEGVGGADGRAPGQWYHVAAVLDRANGVSRLYVNGNADGTNTWTGNTAARDYGTNPWRLGCALPSAAYGGYRWAAKGLIDDPRVYARALSAAEIQILALGVPRVASFTATAGVQQVTLDWTPPAAPAGYSTYAYAISRSIDGGAFTPLANVSGTSYVDTTATTPNGTGPSYTYQIVAISVAASGPLTSNSAIPTLPPPRTEDHDEGLLDGDCACGASAPGAPALGTLAAVALLLAFARRRA